MSSSAVVGRVSALVIAAVLAVLVASCGGDFDYKISGDRPADSNRGGTGEFSGASASSDAEVQRVQELYRAKVEAEQAAGSK